MVDELASTLDSQAMQLHAASIRLELDRTIAGTITLPLAASDLAHDTGGSLRVWLLESVSAPPAVSARARGVAYNHPHSGSHSRTQ